MTRHKAVPMYLYHENIRGFQKLVHALTMEKTQEAITVINVLLKVTTCLYLISSNKARSLSTLIEVNVSKDNAHKVRLENPPGGILPYMGYIGMCRCERYGFQAVYSVIGYIDQRV